jgi:hypothetical protein
MALSWLYNQLKLGGCMHCEQTNQGNCDNEDVLHENWATARKVVKQMFSNNVLGYAEKAEFWTISLITLGDNITAVPPGKILEDATPLLSPPPWIRLCPQVDAR